MKKTNLDLLKYCRAQLGRGYWFSTFGQIATPTLLREKRAQNPKYYTATDFERQFGQKVHDCSGLVKGCLFSSGPDAPARYNAKYDLNADTIIKKCDVSGPISDIPRLPGVLLWKPGHMGVYLGGGHVAGGSVKAIEAKGHKYGVVTTIDTAWKSWGIMSAWFEYLTIEDFVNHLYKAILHRVPEASEINYWTNELNAKRIDASGIVAAFICSPECQSFNYNISDFVVVLYYAMFRRDPDEDGARFWIENAVKFGRDFVLYGMLSTDEWRENAEYYNNL